MCYWVGSRKVREVLLKQLNKDAGSEIPQLFYNTFVDPPNPENKMQFQEHSVAIGKAKPLLTALVRINNELKFKNLQWTLNWKYWDSQTKSEKPGRPLLNSRCENIFWQHKDLIYSKRCIIPVDGYWEFYHFNRETYPYFIYPKDNGLFYLGGIYNEYTDNKTGEITNGFSIITTPPNEVTAKLHNNPTAHDGSRMLLIIDELHLTEYLDSKLTKEELTDEFLKPYDASKMKFHPTVRFLKKEFESYIASDKVQEPWHYPELAG